MDLSYLMYLMSTQPQEGQEQPSLILTLLPWVAILGIFYLIFIRPQQKKQKDHREMLNRLQKGERVMTSGGLIGTVVGVGEDTVTVRFGDNFKAEVGKSYIVNKLES